ncbi:hypothetical protein K239x_57920 [Planctomycetes bacterium K23_9]|uniref:Uncharacterized protein n=2 Tax=Stieleria marina TaxID=1930275 RepID=A0A517P314_9BACT|nr:hypothetical protein K239x_57920 [Planctomycetes bacterium K23_9]
MVWLSITFVGCSGGATNVFPAGGIVRFADGQLLREGTVEFELVGKENAATATGEIQPDGSFLLGTFAVDDGAIAGKHRVAVIADVPIGTGAERPGVIAEAKLDQKYRDFDTSGLEFTVRESSNHFVIEVDYFPLK